MLYISYAFAGESVAHTMDRTALTPLHASSCWVDTGLFKFKALSV